MHITASLSFSSFSVREGHWLVGIRMKELILVNCFSWEAGGGRKEKKLMEARPGRGACAEGHELQSSRTSQKMGDLSASAAFSIVWVFP